MLNNNQREFAEFLAESDVLFFDDGLVLKDGRESPYFLNFGRLNSGKLSIKLASFFTDFLMKQDLLSENSVLVGLSYKASAIAVSCADKLWQDHKINVLFDYDRKESKTYGDASKQKKNFVMGAIKDNSSLILLDDVASSMQTKYDLLGKLEFEKERSGNDFSLDGVLLGVDREQVAPVYEIGDVFTAWQEVLVSGARGKDSIKEFTKKTNVPVFAIANISEIVSYLYVNEILVLIRGEKQVIPDDLWINFVDYFLKYGVKRDYLNQNAKQDLIKTDPSIIVACDLPDLSSVIDLIKQVNSHPAVGGYKIGFELGLTCGLPRLVSAMKLFTSKPIIYDHQKAATDVLFTGEKFAKLMKKSGVDSAILFPRENDEKTQFAYISALQKEGVNVVVGAELTSRKVSKDIERIYWTSVMQGVSDFVVPGNKPNRINFYRGVLENICPNFTLYSPGFISQGGDLSEAKVNHPIIGRAIYDAENKIEVLDDFAKNL